MNQQDLRSGTLCGVLAAVCFTLMGFWVKLLEPHVSVPMILFFRFGISLLILLPFLGKEYPHLFKVKRPWVFFGRTLLNLVSLGCFFQALKYSSFINVLVLVNMAPFFVPIFTWMFFKSKTHATVWIGIGIGFLGILFILHPDQEMLHFSSSLALISGILTALTITLIRALSKVGSLRQILFYNFFLATIITGIVSIFTWQSITARDLLFLLGIGISGALYQLLSTLAYIKIPVRMSSSFMFLCILFGSLLDWLILGLIPIRESLIGMGLVILGGLWILYFGRRHIFSSS
jgi:drug/metabolite transporter (DMT)-like permease